MNNDVWTERKTTADNFRAVFTAVVAELGEDWEVLPDNTPADEYPRTNVEAKQTTTGFVLDACPMWDKKSRMTLRPDWSMWPQYIDTDGQKKTVRPFDLWGPKEETPEMTADMGRPAKAIANQIRRAILDDLPRLYARCQDVANDRQAYTDKTNAALATIKKATMEGDRHIPHSVQCLPGNSVWIKMASADSFELSSLSLSDAVALIAALRKKRAKDAKKAETAS